jgi:hypothetical protein
MANVTATCGTALPSTSRTITPGGVETDVPAGAVCTSPCALLNDAAGPAAACAVNTGVSAPPLAVSV